jgi:hypothetical protein
MVSLHEGEREKKIAVQKEGQRERETDIQRIIGFFA